MSKKKILIADDASTIRMVLKRLLQRLDGEWEISEADEGGSILDTYFELSPDYILLDVELPEVNGWEILSTIRDFDKDTKIIMVTASERTEDVLKAAELGADGFVGKPFDINELADALGLPAEAVLKSA